MGREAADFSARRLTEEVTARETARECCRSITFT
jgi:hypothetical protein